MTKLVPKQILEVVWEIKKLVQISSNVQNSNTSSTNNKNKLVMIKNMKNSVYISPTNLREKLCNTFNGLKINNIYRKSNGIINVWVLTQHDVDLLKNGWTKSIFGKETSIIDLESHLNKKKCFSVILKNVAKNLIDSVLLNSIKENNDDCLSVKRFVKDGRSLGTVKVDFKKEENMNEILNKGITINNVYYPAVEYVFIKKPIQCNKCFKFNHIDLYCTQNQKCIYCNENHDFNTCKLQNSPRCIHCKLDHLSTSRDCSVYKEHLTKINN